MNRAHMYVQTSTPEGGELPGYEFEGITPSDPFAPMLRQLLTTAKKRASVLRENNMRPSNTETQTALYRGAYLELLELIHSLEQNGVQDAP